ncbi:hypothetical protein EYE40_14610 [Glaciihabitans arcticus]|uniref:PH domain-containing protein n=1 Tax=Glaciihabitans arcticus TaxID=2668039 RepID=A0A4Q9GQB0_9MICO|nr:hypothetical protein [Glaciihabitans arcticus]TBN55435.1 hypothetical protein EYE40_14610 [Glaciihabitans arcticus]
MDRSVHQPGDASQHLPSDAVRLLPHRSLFRQALIATLAFLLPVTGALYWITIPDGPWQVVLATQIIASLLFAIASWSFFAVGVWVSPSGIAERGFFGRRTFYPASDVDSILFVETFHGGGDIVPQLFVCGLDNTQLVRMRGQFWSEADMRRVAEVLDVPITEVAESLTPSELLQEYRSLLYWFERHPVWAAAVFSISVVVGGSVIWLVTLLLS